MVTGPVGRPAAAVCGPPAPTRRRRRRSRRRPRSSRRGSLRRRRPRRRSCLPPHGPERPATSSRVAVGPAQLHRVGPVLHDEERGAELGQQPGLGHRGEHHVGRQLGEQVGKAARSEDLDDGDRRDVDAQRPPAVADPAHGVDGAGADRLGAQRVRRCVQPADPDQPPGRRRAQAAGRHPGRAASSAHRQARRARRPCRSGRPARHAHRRRYAPASAASCLPSASSPTRPMNLVGQPAAAAAAATLAALPPRDPLDHGRRVRAPCRRRRQHGDDVLDEIARRRTAQKICITPIANRILLPDSGNPGADRRGGAVVV